MQAETIYKMDREDLVAAIEEVIESSKYDRFYNVMVSTRVVSEIHGVSEKTVINYVKDGLLESELRNCEGGKYQFRLSYVLEIDFSGLRKRLKQIGYE